MLFAVGRSVSMRPFHRSLLGTFPDFFDAMIGACADFHAAATVADNGCILGADTTIDRTFRASQANDTFEAMTDLHFELSTYGSNTERPFLLAEAALSPRNIGPGGCNADFYRDEAKLALVLMTDDGDSSGSAYYVSLFTSMKADPRQVRIYSIAGDYPRGCTTISGDTAGFFEAGYNAALATGGRYYSLCGYSLEDIAYETGWDNLRFPLSLQAVPQTLNVYVDGVRTDDGWEYLFGENALMFGSDHRTLRGSTVEIQYQVLSDCEG